MDDPNSLQRPTGPPAESINPYVSPQASLELPLDAELGLRLNPWVSIWTRPRATIRQILATDPRYMVLPIAAVGGIGQVLDRASMRSMGDHFPLPVILVISLIFGPLGGILGLYVAGLLLRYVGTWLGGHAKAVQVRAAIAWGQLPSVYALVLWIPSFALFGMELFTTDMPSVDNNNLLLILLLSIAAIEIGVGIWSVVTTCKCLGEVHGFSAWMALGSMLIAGVLVLIVIIVPLIVIAVAVIALQSG